MHDAPLLSGMCLCVWKHSVKNPFCSQSSHRRFPGALNKGPLFHRRMRSPLCLSFPVLKSQNTWRPHSSLSNHAKVFNFFSQQHLEPYLALETECVVSVDSRSTSSTEKPAINIPNYTLKPTMLNSILPLDSGIGAALCSPLPCLNLFVSSRRNTVS